MSTPPPNPEVSYVALNGDIHRSPEGPGSGESHRNAAWNRAREALREAFATPRSIGVDYSHSCNAAALLGLSLKAMRWQKPTSDVTERRVEYICQQLDVLLGYALAFTPLLSAERSTIQSRFKWTAASTEVELPPWLTLEKGGDGAAYVNTPLGPKTLYVNDVIVQLASGDLDVLKAKELEPGGA